MSSIYVPVSYSLNVKGMEFEANYFIEIAKVARDEDGYWEFIVVGAKAASGEALDVSWCDAIDEEVIVDYLEEDREAAEEDAEIERAVAQYEDKKLNNSSSFEIYMFR